MRRFQLRSVVIVALIAPVIGPFPARLIHPQPSKLRDWKPQPGRDAPIRILTDEEFRNLPIDEQVRRVDEWQRFQNPRRYSEPLEPSYPLYYGS